MPLTLAPAPWLQFEDENGEPYDGALLFTYQAGTTTKLTTYQDAAGAVAHPNPLELDTAGRVTLYLQSAAYKFVLAPADDTDPPTSPYKTQDNVSAVPFTTVDLDVVAVAGEALTAQDAVYLSAGDGGRTAGAWYKTDADLAYASTTAALVGFVPEDVAAGASGTVRLQGRMTGFVGLSVGSTYYLSGTPGAITTTAPALARPIGMADSLTSLVISAQVSQTPPGLTYSGSDITQIKFAATQVPSTNPNTLDDYEEGLWTPVIGGSGGTSGQTYATQSGSYVKIGQLVYAVFAVTLSLKGTITGDVQIQGLPFTVSSTVPAGDNQAACPVRWRDLATTWVAVFVGPNPGETAADVDGTKVAAASAITAAATADIANSSRLFGTLVYRASA